MPRSRSDRIGSPLSGLGQAVPAAVLRYASCSRTGWGAVVTTTTRTNLGLRFAAIAAILAAAASQAAGAQGPGEAVNVDVGECVKLTTPDERLACFEEPVQ